MVLAAAAAPRPAGQPTARGAGAGRRRDRAALAQPDSGIWELAPAVDPLEADLRGGATRRRPSRAPRLARSWSALADRILADAAAHGLAPAGHWQRGLDDDRVDAALLLPGIRGALPPQDPAPAGPIGPSSRTWPRTATLYRFRPDRRPLGDAEGAFLLCGFPPRLAAGRPGHGRREPLVRAQPGGVRPAGLYTEEYDVRQRQLRGNLPQASCTR